MKDLVEVRARITDDRRQQAARTLVGMSWDDENRIQRSKQTRCVAGGGGGNRDWQRQHELRRLVTYRDAYVKTRTPIGEKEIFVEDIFEKKKK